MKKITIIGSTAYQEKMLAHKKQLESEGYEVSLPAFDSFKDMNEFEVCNYNYEKIKEADEIHVIWDGRSIGTIFDLGMCFALGKRIKIIYLNPKTFSNFAKLYHNHCNSVIGPKFKVVPDGETEE